MVTSQSRCVKKEMLVQNWFQRNLLTSSFKEQKHVAHNKKLIIIEFENTKFNKLNEVVGR